MNDGVHGPIPPDRFLPYLTGPEIGALDKSNAAVVLPVGAIEQHGTHLPLLTDAASAIDVAVSVAEQTGVLVCPPLWFGWSTHHMGYAGTITLRADTFMATLEDIGQSLLVHGF